MGAILYAIIATCLVAQSNSQKFPHRGCVKDMNSIPVQCVTNFYCSEFIDDIRESYNDDDYSCRFLDSIAIDIFRNERIKPANVIFKDVSHDEEVPPSDDSYNRFIYSLDLSANNYVDVPTLTSMGALTSVKFTNNSLTTARLSNRNELPALTELDYSYNIIDNIEVTPDEYQYRYLKKLNMSHNNLVDIPEGVFYSFDALEFLDLSYNHIYTLSVLTFEGIRKLSYLNLSYNRLIDLNSSLLRFSDLVTLELSHNNIQTLKVADFNKLVNVKFLYLSFNDINYAEKNIFADMSSLNVVDLRGNSLESMEQGLFANASGLNTVYLSRNKLKSLPKNMFQGKNVLQFSIEGNELEGSLEKGLFEGLSLVTELDLSGQHLNSVENYAFAGLTHLNTLSLNNNNLRLLSNYSFKGLQNLNELDLSHNNIMKLDIVTEDLISLQMLMLHHNQIATISSDSFIALNSLQLLDLSHNNITHLKSKSFKSLKGLLNFKISQNPLSGSLEGNTFEGLNSLPNLDISGTSITMVHNGSFMGMDLLNELNISHSKITELQFNSLSHLQNIQTIDLSYNQLSKFEVNTTDLINVRTLILSNNLLQTISDTTFSGMNILSKIILSHNNIRSVSKETFNDFNDLRYLDLSYNGDLNFDVSFIEKSRSLTKLLLSGIKADISYERITEIPVTVLEIAHSGIRNITQLNLRLQRLQTLVLSNNALSKLEVGALFNLTGLKQLDLSYNNISLIQPGAFKDNNNLLLLNISHNALKEINYGFFRGLMNLRTIDLSHNIIQSLHKGRFYDVENLETLIADSNRIDFISTEEFSGTHLSTLSIGDNPLPCEILANLKRGGFVDFYITAQRMDDTSSNINGVTCNKDSHVKNNRTSASGEHDKLLLDIRDILNNISRVQIVKDQVLTVEHESPFLANITEQQLQLNRNSLNTLEKLSSVSNLTSTLVNVNSNSNLLLGKILRALTIRDPTTAKPVILIKENATSENVMSYINKMKQDLEETIAIEKQNVLELDKKIEILNSRMDSTMSSTKPPMQDKLVSDVGTQKSSMFVEVCVGLILVILVGFLLFKLYKSKLYIPSSRSFSTRHIAESMENSEV